MSYKWRQAMKLETEEGFPNYEWDNNTTPIILVEFFIHMFYCGRTGP